MFSRRLINNRGRTLGALAAAVGVTTAAAATLPLIGCGRGAQQQGGGRQQQEPTRSASVRLGALLPSHPLWPELGRIDAMLARLGGAVSGTERGGASDGGAYTLPALDARPGDGAERIRRQRAEEQAALRREADANLTAFLEALEYRNSLREAQRRDELEAILRGEIADRMRTGRAQIDAETWAAIAKTGDEQVNLTAKRDALKNDLRTPPLLRSVFDAERLKEDIARVDAAKKRAGQPLGAADRVGSGEPLRNEDGTPLVVSDRARVTSDLREVEARRTGLAAEVARMEAEGRDRIARLNAGLEREKGERIEKMLAAERDEDREENLVGELRQRRDEDIALEAELSARYRAIAGGGARDELGRIRMAAPLPVDTFRAGSAAGGGGASARARLARERRRLEAILRADVADAVRDAAYVRNIAVTIVETTGSTRDDMTERFRVWIRPALDAGSSTSTSTTTSSGARGAARQTPRAPQYVFGGSNR